MTASTALAHTTGTSIGLNFASTDPDYATSGLNAGDSAGVVPSVNWNNLPNASGSLSAAVADSSGTAVATTVSVTWSSPNTWRSGANNAFPVGPNRKLMSGYLDTGNTAATGIFLTVSNLPPSFTNNGYEVYVYFVRAATNNSGGAYTITNQTGIIRKYGSTLPTASSFVEDPGTDLDNSQDGSFLRFSGLGGTWFTLNTDTTLTTPNGFRAPVSALEIVALSGCTNAGIATQPVNRTACAGSTVLLGVSATGSNPSFQWRRNGLGLSDGPTGNGSVLSGTASPTLIIVSSVVADSAGQPDGYDCVITVACDGSSTNSARVALTINPAVTIFSVTGGGTNCPGAGVPVGLSGSELFVDYWLRTNGVFCGVVLPGTGQALSFGNQISSRTYTVVASNTLGGCTALMSSNAVVVAGVPVTIVSGPTPVSLTTYERAAASFSITATGSGLTYQWQRDGTNLANGGNLSGVNSSNLVIYPAGSADSADAGHGYRCVVSGLCNPPAISGEATATIQPFPAPLVPVWTNRYSASPESRDFGIQTAIDSAKYCFTLGGFTSPSNLLGETVLLKHSSTGVVWVAQHPATPRLLAQDASGDLIVSGNFLHPGTNIYDTWIAKYSGEDGSLLWENTRNSLETVDDIPFALGVDPSGNVLVGVRSIGSSGSGYYHHYLAKHSAAGSLLWELDESAGTDLATSFQYQMGRVDPDGNLIAFGYQDNSHKLRVAKYSGSNGDLLWSWVSSTNNFTLGFSDRTMAVDADGNVIIAATIITADNYDYYTAKLAAASGALLWEKRYNGPANAGDFPYDVAADSQGNVIVTGTSAGFNSSGSSSGGAYTVKYAATNGAVLWENRYTGPFGLAAHGFAIAADAADNVLVAGRCWVTQTGGGAVGGYDAFLLKCSGADGAFLWEGRHSGTNDESSNWNDGWVEMTVAPDGSVLVTGQEATGTNTFDADLVTMLYAPSGNQLPLMVNPIPDTNAAYGVLFEYTFPTNTFVDPDTNQFLIYYALGMPQGISFSPGLRTFSGRPSQTGTFPITVTATEYGYPFLSTNDVFVITIPKVPLSITASNATQVYGDAPPYFVGNITGETNGDIFYLTFNCVADFASPIGGYTIAPEIHDNGNRLINYTVTTNDGTLAITPAPLTIIANNANMTFGTPIPALTGTVAGLRNGDNITANFETTATNAMVVPQQPPPPGQYPITVSALNDPSGKLGNYSVVTNNGVLAIDPPQLTIFRQLNTIVISWPVTPTSIPFLQEATGTIDGNGEWFTITNGITQSNGLDYYTVTNDAVVPARFYRLLYPLNLP